MTHHSAPIGGPTGATIALRFWASRRRLILYPLAVGVVTAAISLLVPNEYTAVVSVMPDKQGSLASGALAQAAASFGVNVANSGGGLTDLYPAMITSERILVPLITRPLPTRRAGEQRTLLQVWRLDDLSPPRSMELALKRLRTQALAVSLDRRSGLVTVSVTLADPVFAAAIANAISAELDAFVRVFQRTQAQNRVGWIQTRQDQVLEELRRSEVVLRDFRIRNRNTLASPELQLQEARFLRDVESNSAVYVELRRQLELAKIDEVKNIPVIQILDTARAPVRKSAPRRSILVLSAMALTFLATLGSILMALRLEHDPNGEGALVLTQVRADLLALWARRRTRA
jgi:uncharacterized protein involved in exopolysaccharide biosynthesis